jgi:hypothetical protein
MLLGVSPLFLFGNGIAFAIFAEGVREEKNNGPLGEKNMRYIHIICIGLIFLLIGASTNAEESRSDGNALLQDCTDPSDIFGMGLCLGLLRGVRDTRTLYTIAPSAFSDCVPQEVTIGQVRSIVVKYLQDHPEKLHYRHALLVNFALSQAFPCPVQPAAK